jgi:hypothetical protein
MKGVHKTNWKIDGWMDVHPPSIHCTKCEHAYIVSVWTQHKSLLRTKACNSGIVMGKVPSRQQGHIPESRQWRRDRYTRGTGVAPEARLRRGWHGS